MGGTRRSEWPMIRRAISGNLVELARILATAGPISGRLFSSSDDAGPALRSKRTERCVRNVAYGTLADIFGHFAPMLPSPLHEAGVSPTTALASRTSALASRTSALASRTSALPVLL